MSRVWKDRCIMFFLILLSLYLSHKAWYFPARGGVFPIFSFACIILLCLGYLIGTFRGGRPAARPEPVKKAGWNELKPYILCLFVILEVVLMTKIGYFVTTALFLFCAPLILGLKNYRLILLTLVIILPLFYIFFVIGLKADLPAGILM